MNKGCYKCGYYTRGMYDKCEHPSNIKITKERNYGQGEYNVKEYLKKPRQLNEELDCKNFEEGLSAVKKKIFDCIWPF